MSREYMVLLVDEPANEHNIDGQAAQVFMRFTEQPDEEFLGRVSQANPGKRVYCLLGASTWFNA